MKIPDASSAVKTQTKKNEAQHHTQNALRNYGGGFYRLRIMKRFRERKKIKNIDNLG